MFADGLKLYTQLELNDSYAFLQNELDLLNSWYIKWQLTISKKKFIFVSETFQECRKTSCL